MRSTLGARAFGLALLLLAFGGCTRRAAKTTRSTALDVPAAGPLPTADTATAAPDDGQWTMAAHDYANTRYSGLHQITTANVARLKVAWTFSTGVLRGHEEAPLVVGSTMYLVTPYPNMLYALDLTRPGAPVKWTYQPNPAPSAQGVACCDVVNRGAVYADGKIFFNTLDVQTVAVDTADGHEVWRTSLGSINQGETITMSPLVVNGKVLVGNSGGEFGVRGWITALDESSGKIAWRAYSTGPDSSVLIGPDFKPFYADEKGKDLGVSTWPPGAWKLGGGNVWGFISYDPELDLIYHGTGNPGPWNAELRPGDNKWTAGIFARRPEDGRAIWAYQFSPHDLFDHDGINENVLVDLPWQGKMRKLLLRPDRNGYLYVLDRVTGQVLSATPFGHITSSLGVDLKTGRLIRNPAKEPHTGIVVREICPSSPGMKDWQPSSWSPRLHLLFIPHQNLCMDFQGTEANYIVGTPYVGAITKFYAGPGGNQGELLAWDPIAARPVWRISEALPVWSGTLATAGDLVFYGTMDGWFKAVDARNGHVLWQFKTGSGIIGQPMTYRGPDGKQYFAIVAGMGGWPGSIVAAHLDTRDSTAGNGWGVAMRDLPNKATPGGTLYVFALP